MQVLVSTMIGNTVVALALALLALLAMRLRRPAMAHVLWLLVIVKLLTPPVWRVAVTTPPDARVEPAKAMVVVDAASRDVVIEAAPTRVLMSVVTPVVATPATAAPSPDVTSVASAPPAVPSAASAPTPALAATPSTVCIPCILGGVWLLGSITWAIVTATRIIRFRRLLLGASPPPDELRSEVAAVAARMGALRVPDIRLVDAAVSPMLFFLGRRVQLILPRGLAVAMPRARRAGVIAHELAHLRRGDHWVRVLEMLATTILWWHPLIWLARRGLREAEEQCCDAWVVALLPGADARRGYADALVDALEHLATRRVVVALPASATGLGRIDHLRRRITMILTETTPKSVSRAGQLCIAALAIVLVPLSFVRGQAEEAVPAARTGDAGALVAEAAPATTATTRAGNDDEARLAVEALLDRAVQDSDDHVRNTALNAIRQFGPRAIPALLDGVKNERTAEFSRNLLAGLGPRSLDALLAAVESPDAQVRREALLAMAQILGNTYHVQLQGYGAVPPGAYGGGGRQIIAGGFNSARPPAPGFEMMEGGAAFGAGQMPEPVTRLIPAVTKAARDGDAGVRRAAVQVLAHVMLIAAPARQSDALMPTLLSAMTDADAEVRAMAIGAFQSAGDAAASATPALTKAVKDENDQVRLWALMALRAIGPAAREATPAVIAALKDPQPPIRAAAAEALGALQAPPQQETMPTELNGTVDGMGIAPAVAPGPAPAPDLTRTSPPASGEAPNPAAPAKAPPPPRAPRGSQSPGTPRPTR